MCPPMWAHWRHLANIIELVLRVGLPQSTTQTANRLVLHSLQQKVCKSLFFTMGDPNSIVIGSAIFAQMTTECLYTLQWDALSPNQSCPFPWGDLDCHLIHGWPTGVLNPKSISVG